MENSLCFGENEYLHKTILGSQYIQANESGLLFAHSNQRGGEKKDVKKNFP
jgi:hypothetical protein